jgi:hypothetical protein
LKLRAKLLLQIYDLWLSLFLQTIILRIHGFSIAFHPFLQRSSKREAVIKNKTAFISHDRS